jgi:hypothetical protein
LEKEREREKVQFVLPSLDLFFSIPSFLVICHYKKINKEWMDDHFQREDADTECILILECVVTIVFVLL